MVTSHGQEIACAVPKAKVYIMTIADTLEDFDTSFPPKGCSPSSLFPTINLPITLDDYQKPIPTTRVWGVGTPGLGREIPFVPRLESLS